MTPLEQAISTLNQDTDALSLVLKLLSNVLANQNEPKYRRVKTTNAKLNATLFSKPGGREILLACGFVGTDELVLPDDLSLVRLLQARDAKAWMNARDVLYKILKNISEHPNEGKYRRLNKKAGGSFVEKVWSVRFARECLVACGFTETADAVELILDTQRPETNAKTLTKCRVLLSRLEPAIKARDAHVRLAREDDSSSGVNRRHLAPNKKCSHCSNEIESGARRLWTTDPFAPKGQYSFKCSQCVDKDYILCETCWDKKIENREPKIEKLFETLERRLSISRVPYSIFYVVFYMHRSNVVQTTDYNTAHIVLYGIVLHSIVL